MVLSALARGGSLRLEVRLGGGWFCYKQGEEVGERTRLAASLPERLQRDGLIERDGGSGLNEVFRISHAGRDWITKHK
jgi:hypothetical protein